MKYWNQLVCCLLAVLTVSACSDTASERQQAKGNFDYLSESTSSPLKYSRGAEPQFRHDYDIPAGDFNGLLGKNVDIRPPQEYMALIPGVSLESKNSREVTLWAAKPEVVDQIWRVLLQVLETQHVQLQRRDKQLINATWEWQSEDEESPLEAHYQFSRVQQGKHFGIQASLLDLKTADSGNNVSGYSVERYTMKMVNKVAETYDAQMRVTESLSQQVTQSIPVSMGTDRSGLPVVIARVNYDGLWRRLPLALSKVGFSVEDRNRSQGTIKVKFSQPDDDVWSELKVKPLSLASGSYTILLGDLENRTSVNVTSDKGKPVKDEELQELAPVMAALLK